MRARELSGLITRDHTTRSPYTLRVEDRKGTELFRTGVQMRWMSCGGWHFHVDLPRADSARSVSLFYKDTEIDRIDAPDLPPQLLEYEPVPGVYAINELESRWLGVHANGERAPAFVSGLFSLDEGRHRITSLRQRKGLFEFVVTDGFWETRVVQSYAVISDTKRIIIRPSTEPFAF